MLYKTRREIADKLLEASSHIEDEYGEYLSHLANLCNRITDMGSEKFIEEYDKAIKLEAKNLEDNYEWVEEEITTTYTEKYLKWKDE